MKETLHRRPKLLFLAHTFPPLRMIGSVRTWNIAKYLARLGWDVTVVTPHPSVWRDVENPEHVTAELERAGIRRILTGHQWRCLLPESLNCWNRGIGWCVGGVCRKIARRLGIEGGIGWIKESEQACSDLTANDVDIILATGMPFAAFRLAKRLSDRLGCPYVLDYRDPWTGQLHSKPLARPATLREEAELLAGCAAVTVVSALYLDARHGLLGSKLHVITNGFDLEEMARVKPYDFGHFAIVYTGLFYPPERVITPVMGALRRLKETEIGQSVEWRFHYYGPHGNYVHEEAERFGVMEQVVLHGRVSRAEALSAVRGSGVTVVITSVLDEGTPEERGIVPGKLFEPLGLGKPILLVAPRGSFTHTIIKTTGLARIFTGSNIDGMTSFFADAMCGQTPKPKNPDAYAWMKIIKRLDIVLREAMEKKGMQSALLARKTTLNFPLKL